MLSSLLFGALLHLQTGMTTTCDIPAGQLTATYAVSQQHAGHPGQTATLVLWRNGNQVAHQHPQTGITESWTHVKQRWIKPVRYFDDDERAIEYMPGERIHGKADTDWSLRYQLISDALLSQMTLVDETGEGCERTQQFSLNTATGAIHLTWQPALRLVRSFEQVQGENRQTWTLTSITQDNEAITQFFRHRDGYYSTDFADIGDDHTDPFLIRMVNQGFIQPGASGFYTADGTPLAGTHDHAH
ncbi:hypothetical protein [Alteromonas sp. CYL-A6]|uniref:hypothetical protein n=1 Tax=Alteromonas nitratireducens TaxID=3390813 RepID=UPI0034A76E1A